MQDRKGGGGDAENLVFHVAAFMNSHGKKVEKHWLAKFQSIKSCFELKISLSKKVVIVFIGR